MAFFPIDHQQAPCKHAGRCLLLLCVLLGLSGCDYLPFGATPIGQVHHQSAAFDGREVKLRGKVVSVNKIPLIDVKFYTLSDDTGEVFVSPQAQLPRVGDVLVVRGQVKNLGIFANYGVGTWLQETSSQTIAPEFEALLERLRGFLN
ncbi:MAG: OB-fold nucleic acid binding domain-containing protein [Candidatus Methylumidiphilus sp.]